MNNNKVKAILDWPVPRTVKQVQSFLGFANFYRRFIQDYSAKVKPLTMLTQKDLGYSWGLDQQQAFDMLKQSFTTAPILQMPDFSRPFIVEVDASDFATGGILSQRDDEGILHPVAFRSQSLSPAERNYEIFDKELLAIIQALEEWRCYLEGAEHEFTILTDHKNLEYFHTNRNLSRRQARWSQYLTCFKFKLIHRTGKASEKPDALSRRADHPRGDHDNEDQILLKPEYFHIAATKEGYVTISTDDDILDRIKEEMEKDSFTEFIREGLAKGTVPNWQEDEGFLFNEGKLYVPPDNKALLADILKRYHDSPTAGHLGEMKTRELVSRTYWWPRMTIFVKQYVSTCETCKRTKVFPQKPHGLLQPNPIPDGPWRVSASDFIVGLPESEGYNAILVVVDRFSKFAHFIPTTNECDAEEAANLYLQNVWKIWGTPIQHISDRGSQFASKFMKQLFKRLQIKTSLSTAYHPQTDGQTERTNAELKQFLRVFINYRQDDWLQWIPIAEFSYNNRVNVATGKSPFQILFGFDPKVYVTPTATSNVPAADRQADHLIKIREEAQASLNRAADDMKRFYDRHHQEVPEYNKGDKVWLDMRNINTERPSKSLDNRRTGPYEIIEKIGPLDYKLKLPPKFKVHPVFHASLLYPYKEDTIEDCIQPRPPPVVADDGEGYEVEEILDSRVKRKRFQYLVKWVGYPHEDNSWVSPSDMNAKKAIEKFHKAHPQAPRVVPEAVTAQLRFRQWTNYTSTPKHLKPILDLSSRGREP